ncbi:MAG: tryptophan-rich sensory protein [Candidatus Acidiferrales bacterium]
MPNWVLAAGVCVAALIFETLCAGGDPGAALKQLRQPRWALPLPAWVAIGLGYYAACYLALLRLLDLAGTARSCITLLVVLMAANGLWNYFFFRRRNYRLSFWYLFPYVGLAVVVLWCVLVLDRTAGFVVALYFSYLPYALAWTFRVWKMNDNSQAEVRQ